MQQRTGETTTDDDILEDRRATAAALGIGLATLDRLIKARDLPVVRIGDRVLIRRRDRLDFVARNLATSSTTAQPSAELRHSSRNRLPALQSQPLCALKR